MPATLRDYREEVPPPLAPLVQVRGSSHQDRRQILPALDAAMHTLRVLGAGARNAAHLAGRADL